MQESNYILIIQSEYVTVSGGSEGREHEPPMLVVAAAAAFQFVVMCFAAAACVFIAAALLIGLRDDSRNGHVASASIHGNDCQIRGADMLALVEKDDVLNQLRQRGACAKALPQEL